MSDAARLEEAFRSGRLLRPDGGPNLVDLSHAIARIAGADVELAPAVERAIGPADHLVFVLVDGLGMNLVESLPAGSFLRTHLAMELRSVFPSSTAPALTTLVTGVWPGRHAVPAWWTHLPRAGVTATILPFVERFGGKPLGLRPEEVFPEPTVPARFRRDARSFLPRMIAESTYSRYARGGTAGEGYDAFPLAVDAVVRRVASASAPTYTYLYEPNLDAAEHKFGPRSPEARAVLERIEGEVGRLADGIRGRARVVLSADHGQTEVPDSAKSFLAPDDPLLDHLEVPPSGEPRVPMFHARPGFAEAFRGRFGDRFALLSIDEAAPLFGPGPFAPEARARIGSFVAVAEGPEILMYGPPKHHLEEAALRGHHGGLTPDEMRVPLVVA